MNETIGRTNVSVAKTEVEFSGMGDQFFQHLAEMNKKFISIRRENEMLLSKLRGANVAFSDIQRFLINRAKEVGLHQMSEYAGPGKRRHRTFDELKRDQPRWFVMTMRFVKSVQSKYTDYDVEKKRVTYARPDRDDSSSLRADTVGKPNVVAKRDGKSKVNAKGANKGLTEKQLDQSAREKGSTTHLEEAINLNITAPVKEELSLLQVQTIILQNLDVLGRIAKAKGAVDEFNALMIKIGAEDEVIVSDSDSSLRVDITAAVSYSEAAVQ